MRASPGRTGRDAAPPGGHRRAPRPRGAGGRARLPGQRRQPADQGHGQQVRAGAEPSPRRPVLRVGARRRDPAGTGGGRRTSPSRCSSSSTACSAGATVRRSPRPGPSEETTCSPAPAPRSAPTTSAACCDRAPCSTRAGGPRRRARSATTELRGRRGRGDHRRRRPPARGRAADGHRRRVPSYVVAHGLHLPAPGRAPHRGAARGALPQRRRATSTSPRPGWSSTDRSASTSRSSARPSTSSPRSRPRT